MVVLPTPLWVPAMTKPRFSVCRLPFSVKTSNPVGVGRLESHPYECRPYESRPCRSLPALGMKKPGQLLHGLGRTRAGP